MAAVIGLEDHMVEQVCGEIDEIVIPANYNSPGQLVISGSVRGVEIAMKRLEELEARRVVRLMVGGAFHSPLMESAKQELQEAIYETHFSNPTCPIYQNVTARATSDPDEIRKNLIEQLISPVLWTQTVRNMLKAGATSFIEVGPGQVLQGLVKKVDRSVQAFSAALNQ
jgi:[acyl-carrier-protein] S-malonyltransferase